MKTHFLLFIIGLYASASLASARSQKDPVGDLHMNISGLCQSPTTDIVSTHFEKIDNQYVVTLQLVSPVSKMMGYKEYYFWLDVTHNTKKGYRPYMPDSAAWKNFYADYRIFYSVDANDRPPFVQPYEKVTVQKCLETDCSKDQGMLMNKNIQVETIGSSVIFRWPVGIFSDLDLAKKIKVGYTTYFALMQCNGEDDSPQWGEHPHEIELSAPSLNAPEAD
jgi:hypothetical protein